MKIKSYLKFAAAIAAFMFISVDGQAQLGIGLRAGDPSGITIKKYTGDNALEFNIGRSGYWGYNRGWYDNRFDKWRAKQNYNYSDIDYVGYSRSTAPLALQIHYLIHNPLDGDNPDLDGLTWYYGFGAQLRFQRFRYAYWYKIEGDPEWYYDETGVTNLDIGADGTAGLEYTFDEYPISVFLDVTLFLELIDDPFRLWSQAGIGIRYNL